MQTKNDTTKPEDAPQQEAGEGCLGATCSARWRLRSKIEWTPLRDWHPAFYRSWWISGQIGEYATDAFTIGFRICGLFVGVWVFLPNAQVEARR